MTRDAEATAPDGTPLSYRVSGPDRPGRRIALVHSLAMDAGFWDPVTEALSDTAEVLAVECRGHGRSGKPAGPYTAEEMGDDLAAVLGHAGWDTAAVAGASMGGVVALAFGTRHRARCTGLGLIDTTAWYGADAAEKWEGRARKALDHGMEALVDFQKTRWFSDGFRETATGVVEPAVAVFLANDVAAYAEACRMLGRADLRAGLADLTMPVEIVVGDEDYATPPEMAEALRTALPDARLEVLAGRRHFTPLEDPAAIAAALSRLLDRSAATG